MLTVSLMEVLEQPAMSLHAYRVLNGHKTEPVSLADISQAIAGRLAIVGWLRPPRPGTILFGMLLEHRHFEPMVRANHPLFQLFIVPWEVADFQIVVVPRQARRAVEGIVDELKLNLRDGVPRLHGHVFCTQRQPVKLPQLPDGPIRSFPFDEPNVFTLEPNWERVRQTPDAEVRWLLEENARVQALLAAVSHRGGN